MLELAASYTLTFILLVSTPEFSTKNRWFLRVVSTVVLVVRYDPSYMLRSVKDAILLETETFVSSVTTKRYKDPS